MSNDILLSLGRRTARELQNAVPWSDMSALMLNKPDLEGSMVDRLIGSVFTGETGLRIEEGLTSLMTAARDHQLLKGPVENPGGSPWLETLNDFLEGQDVDRAHLVAPLMAMMKSEVIWSATPGRKRRGEAGPRHLEMAFDQDLFWNRINVSVANLETTLARGTTDSWHAGVIESTGARSQRRITLADWCPVLQERNGQSLSWGPTERAEPLARAELSETQPEP